MKNPYYDLNYVALEDEPRAIRQESVLLKLSLALSSRNHLKKEVWNNFSRLRK